MQQPSPAEKRRAITIFAAMIVGGLVITSLVTAGLGAILSLVWNAAAARGLGAPTLGFFPAWGIAVLTGFMIAGARIARDEHVRRKKPL